MGTDAQIGRGHTEIEIPAMANVDPGIELGGRLLGSAEILHLHLFELPGAKHELARSDLIAKALPDLGDTEGELETMAPSDVVEVDEDALGRFRPEVDEVRLVFDRAHVGSEHEVEGARLGEAIAGIAIRTDRCILEFVEPESLIAVATLDQGVGEDRLVAGRLPNLTCLEDGRVEADDVVSLLHHRAATTRP